VSVRKAFMIHAKCDGSVILKKALDCSKENLNIYRWGKDNGFNSCSIQFNGKCIRLHVTRFMTDSGDGLNHQSGRIATYDCETLENTDNGGKQTASHSFASGSGVCDGKFVDVDLGDNYPRGIICNFDGKEKIVYSFKTLHVKRPKNMAG